MVLGQGSMTDLRHWIGLLAIGIICLAAPARADDAFQGFIESLWPEAEAAGVSRPTFDQAFDGLTPDLSLPDLALPGKPKSLKGQAEFTKPAKAYLDPGYLAKLATQGQAFMAQHAKALARIEKMLGVDPRILVAIWGRETAFGTYKLPFDAIRTLATQSYIGQRKARFRPELIYALKMLEDGIARKELRSSWAGAVGQTQFMPSDFYSHAIDGDGDGVKDIFHSEADALASAAKQLQDKGWVPGGRWFHEIALPKSVDCSLEGPPDNRPIADWVKLGAARKDGQKFSKAELASTAYLMLPEGTNGPAFLAPANFTVIRAYNTSDLYALFVGNLADRLSGGGDLITPWGAAAQPKTKTVEDLQKQLKKLGYGIEKFDGKIGSNTRRQVGRFQKAAGLPVTCWPSDDVLSAALAAPVQ